MREVTTRLGKNECLEIKEQYRNTIPFKKCGDNMNNNANNSAVDIINFGMEASPREWFALDILRRNARYLQDKKLVGGVVVYNDTYNTDPVIKFTASKQLSARDAEGFKRGITALKAKDIVRSTTRCRYMINPYLLVPNNVEDHVEAWNKLAN